MSLAWRILLFAVLLNVVTVSSVQMVVHSSQQQWFEEQRKLLSKSVHESFSELERVYPAKAVDDAALHKAVVRRLLRSASLREIYDDVIVTKGRPPYEGVYLNTMGAVHRDPDRFPFREIEAGFDYARSVDGRVPVANGYCGALRREGRVVGFLWFVPKIPQTLPTSLPIWSALFGVAVSMLLFGVVLVWLTRRTVGRPLHDVGDAAQAVAAGHYDVRLPQSGVPELRPLVTTFNRMAAQVQSHTTELEAAVQKAVAETEQKERALVMSSRLATIGTLAAGVAHEINNPIAGMQNTVLRLLQAEGLSDRQKQYLELVQNGLHRISRTTRRMLEFSPKDAELRAFDVRQAIEQAHALVVHRSQQENVEFEIVSEESLPEVHGDAHEIQQVMLNLFLNSLDALDGRGGQVVVRCSRQADMVRVVVADNGPGMPTEMLPRVFDPFFTKKDRPDASGLGMFICFSIVQTHGGTMRVDSEPGEGFRTTIELPLSPTEPPPVGTPAQPFDSPAEEPLSSRAPESPASRRSISGPPMSGPPASEPPASEPPASEPL